VDHMLGIEDTIRGRGRTSTNLRFEYGIKLGLHAVKLLRTWVGKLADIDAASTTATQATSDR